MEAVDEQNGTDLREALSRLLAVDGSWDPSAVQKLSPETWEEWFRARLDDCDPHFGYDREAYATHPANLFRALFDDLDAPNTEDEGDVLDTEDAALGLAQYLDSLDPSEENGTTLREAIDLVLHVRPRYTSAREGLRATLRNWIGAPENSALLNRDEDRVAPETLLRKALFALAALQYPGGYGPNGVQNDDRDIETFRAWLDHPDVAEAAFSGLGLALPSTPEEGVVYDFLVLCEEEDIQPKYPLETLFIGRSDREAIRTYLWKEMQEADHPEERWNKLQEWLNDEFYLPSYHLMESRRDRDSDFGTGGTNPTPSEEKGPTWTRSFAPAR